MLRIGTSGWNYPSGKGTWNGLFYPARSGRGAGLKGFDELSWYAEHFDTVEVNSSFYGPPTPETTRRWVEKTPPGFEFSLKLHQQFTHPEMFKRTALGAPARRVTPGRWRSWRASTTPTSDKFKSGLDPIATAGKLGALLAQFPASFKDTPQNRAYLEWLLTTFREYPVAVELRHKTWSDQIGATLELLGAYKAAWVQIDEPKFQLSIRQNFLPNVKGFYYMRLHGRNAAQWWKHDAVRGSLQLPLLGRRAAALRRNRDARPTPSSARPTCI